MINPTTGLEYPTTIKLPESNPGGVVANPVAYSPGKIDVAPSAQVGLINPGVTPPASNPAQAQGVVDPSTITPPPQASPTPWNVTNRQSVEERVRGLINTDTPLQQQAETRANQQMNSRGLLSSSAAVGAAQDAVINSALPIAQADAQINARAAEFNATASNQFKTAENEQQNKLAQLAKSHGYNLDTMSVQQKADLGKMSVLQGYDLTKMDKQAANSLLMLNAQTVIDMDKMAKEQGYTLDKMDAQQINELSKAAVMQGYEAANKLADRKTQLAVNQLLVDNKELVDTMSSAQKAVASYSDALNAIANNKDLSGVVDVKTGYSPKTQAIHNAKQMLETALNVIGAISGTDIIKIAGLSFPALGASPEEVKAAKDTAEADAKAISDAAAAQAAADAAVDPNDPNAWRPETSIN